MKVSVMVESANNPLQYNPHKKKQTMGFVKNMALNKKI